MSKMWTCSRLQATPMLRGNRWFTQILVSFYSSAIIVRLHCIVTSDIVVFPLAKRSCLFSNPHCIYIYTRFAVVVDHPILFHFICQIYFGFNYWISCALFMNASLMTSLKQIHLRVNFNGIEIIELSMWIWFNKLLNISALSSETTDATNQDKPWSAAKSTIRMDYYYYLYFDDSKHRQKELSASLTRINDCIRPVFLFRCFSNTPLFYSKIL